MSQMILGVFSETEHAENAITKLENRDYNPKDISIVMKEKDKGKKMAQKTGADVSSGAISGVTTGGVIGALAGLLVSAGVVPGLGALFIAGPLATALGLTGAAATTISGAATGALTGGLLGALGGLGLAAKDAADYEESIKQGGILVAVPARRGNEDEVRNILREHGADKIRVISDDETEHRHYAAM